MPRFPAPLTYKEQFRNNKAFFSNLPVQSNPDYAVYFNDFLVAQDYAAADWVVTTTEAGAGSATEALAADERFGALLLTNDDADNDLDALQLNEETWKLEAGERLWFSTRLKISDATQSDIFVGLGITDTTILATTDRIGFEKLDGSAVMTCLTEKDSTETNTSSGVTVVADTYNKFEFYWDGISRVYFFIDRALVATHSTNVPDDENLCLTIHLQNGEAAAKTCTIDYFWVVAERV